MGAQLALAMLDWDETPCALGDAFGDDYEGMMGCRALLNSLDCERAFDICTAGSRSGHRRWSKRKREAKLRLASPSARPPLHPIPQPLTTACCLDTEQSCRLTSGTRCRMGSAAPSAARSWRTQGSQSSAHGGTSCVGQPYVPFGRRSASWRVRSDAFLSLRASSVLSDRKSVV